MSRCIYICDQPTLPPPLTVTVHVNVASANFPLLQSVGCSSATLSLSAVPPPAASRSTRGAPWLSIGRVGRCAARPPERRRSDVEGRLRFHRGTLAEGEGLQRGNDSASPLLGGPVSEDVHRWLPVHPACPIPTGREHSGQGRLSLHNPLCAKNSSVRRGDDHHQD